MGILGTWRLYCVENRLWTSREESPPRDQDWIGEQGHCDPTRCDSEDRVLSTVPHLATEPGELNASSFCSPSREGTLSGLGVYYSSGRKEKNQLKKFFRLCSVGHFASNWRGSGDDA